MRILRLILVLIAAVNLPVRADPRPNVLMIIVDDLRDWIGCLGGYGGESPTPNIDRLAARGMLFTRAYTAAPLCNPSRTAVLTGLRPSTTGIYNNDQWWRPAVGEIATLPEHFKACGYETVGAGKVAHHMPGFNPPQMWHRYFKQLFDDPYHRPSGSMINSVTGMHWPSGFPLNGLGDAVKDWKFPFNPREFDWGPFDKADEQMADGQMATWAVEFLNQPHDRPFFFAAGVHRPHLPWYAPQKYFDQTPLDSVVMPPLKAGDLDDVPPIGLKFARVSSPEVELLKRTGKYREAVRAYLAAIRFADAQVGRIVEALDHGPSAANTIVLLWSDHGWHLGEKDHWLKSTLWEEATRVPVIVVAPGLTTPGSRCNRTVSLLDLYPTLMDLCGLPSPRHALEGASWLPLLNKPSANWDRPSVMTYLRGNHAVRDERWRYIRYADGTEELYDHTVDPHEWTNLASSPNYTAAKHRLSQKLPGADAPDAPLKDAYDFNFDSYTWTRKPTP
jgi:arylsulfatase A-like enzyme